MSARASIHCRLVRCVTAFVLAAITLNAAPGPQGPAFDTVSVKVNDSDFPGGIVDLRPGRFDGTNATLRELLTSAYDLETFRIVGGPEWIDSDRFDVQAWAATAVSRADTMLMMRAMLADRFQLRARVERRDGPVFALVKTRSDRIGPRLRPSSSDACTGEGAPPPPSTATRLPVCGRISAGPGRMSGRTVTMDLLAIQLSPRVSRVVENRTGLTGTFDFDLEWAVNEAARAALARLSPDGTPPPADATRPELATALGEQLGVRLEPGRGLVEVLVVESAQKPSPN